MLITKKLFRFLELKILVNTLWSNQKQKTNKLVLIVLNIISLRTSFVCLGRSFFEAQVRFRNAEPSSPAQGLTRNIIFLYFKTDVFYAVKFLSTADSVVAHLLYRNSRLYQLRKYASLVLYE